MKALTANFVSVEQKLIVATQRTNVSVYDFDFELFFDCRHPSYFQEGEVCVLRTGALPNYAELYAEYVELGLRPIHTPEQHLLASELKAWYPLIADLTPKSICVDTFPSADFIDQEFGWPVFIKGSRQTSKHNPQTSIIRSPEQYQQAQIEYQRDPILHWQSIAIRQFVELQPVSGEVAGKILPSLEFRTFWWFGSCVGWGRYWYQVAPYEAPDIQEGLALAQAAAERLGVPFLVVDIAKTLAGDWIVIECNDAQESGYVGIDPRRLWQRILECAFEV